jgi:hypothetical protein
MEYFPRNLKAIQSLALSRAKIYDSIMNLAIRIFLEGFQDTRAPPNLKT